MVHCTRRVDVWCGRTINAAGSAGTTQNHTIASGLDIACCPWPVAPHVTMCSNTDRVRLATVSVLLASRTFICVSYFFYLLQALTALKFKPADQSIACE